MKTSFGAACSAILVAGGMLTGCHAPVTGGADTPAVRPPAFRLPMPELMTPAELPAVDRLAASPAGPGLVVCDPVNAGGSRASGGADLAAFGSGCAAWLQFALGGQPEMGQTVPWPLLSRLPLEFKRTDLAIAQSQAPIVASMIGATNAITGVIAGDQRRVTITWAIQNLQGSDSALSKLQMSGTPAQILSRLPALAKAAGAKLGIQESVPFPAVAASPADITFLGQLRWRGPAMPQQMRLEALAKKCPLAGVDYLPVAGRWNEQLFSRSFTRLDKEAPGSTVVICQACESTPAAIEPSPSLLREWKRFPHNFQLSLARLRFAQVAKKPGQEILNAEAVVESAPRSPDAWLSLGRVLADQAEAIRRGRTVADLTPAEGRLLNGIYAQWLAAVQHAARLDPRFAKAWLRVSEAGTFAGDFQTADAALKNAIRLDPSGEEAYFWGIQMYQPRWFDDPGRLAAVARQFISLRPTSLNDRRALAIDLGNAGFAAPSFEMLKALIKDCKTDIKRDPSDIGAHYNLARALQRVGNLKDATREMRLVTSLAPAYADAHHQLGWMLDQRADPECADEYRQAVTLCPHNSDWRYDYGWALVHTAQDPEATQEFVRAIQLDPANVDARFALAEELGTQKFFDQAAEQERDILIIAPDYEPACRELAFLYARAKRYPDALKMARRAMELAPYDRGAQAALLMAERRVKTPDRHRQA
ncbi:MAG: tetratricopeptide repeat protein [Chloroflexi bacterium]|nr:tetratricopeptide repeat protein [Chloroflexota bacterium]